MWYGAHIAYLKNWFKYPRDVSEPMCDGISFSELYSTCETSNKFKIGIVVVLEPRTSSTMKVARIASEIHSNANTKHIGMDQTIRYSPDVQNTFVSLDRTLISVGKLRMPLLLRYQTIWCEQNNWHPNSELTFFMLSTWTVKLPGQPLPVHVPLQLSSCGATQEEPMLEAMRSRTSCWVVAEEQEERSEMITSARSRLRMTNQFISTQRPPLLCRN